MTLDDDLQGVRDDLESVRSGGPSGQSSNGGTRPVGKADVQDLDVGADEGSMPTWAKNGIYAALIIAIIQIYVGFEVPDGTVLVGAALAFLVLGLWAGTKLPAERKAELRERWEQWRK